MGNTVCARPQPIENYRTTQDESPDSAEKQRLSSLVNAKKTADAPKLVLGENSLYLKRKNIPAFKKLLFPNK